MKGGFFFVEGVFEGRRFFCRGRADLCFTLTTFSFSETITLVDRQPFHQREAIAEDPSNEVSIPRRPGFEEEVA
jgi:hypothetical protein